MYPNEYIPYTDEIDYESRFNFLRSEYTNSFIELKDYGPEPFVVNID